MKIENTCFPKTGNVGISRMSITYTQDNDTIEANKDGQFLTIETESTDNGYFLTIQTERWAIDNPKELESVLDNFMQRLNYQNNAKKIKNNS